MTDPWKNPGSPKRIQQQVIPAMTRSSQDSWAFLHVCNVQDADGLQQIASLKNAVIQILRKEP